MSLWSWLPTARLRSDLVRAREEIATHLSNHEETEAELGRLHDVVAQLTSERDEARETARLNNQVVDLLKERLAKRDDEYEALHVRYLALVDRQAAAAAARITERREVVPPTPPPTYDTIRQRPIHESNLAEVPRQPTTEEVEARFQQDK